MSPWPCLSRSLHKENRLLVLVLVFKQNYRLPISTAETKTYKPTTLSVSEPSRRPSSPCLRVKFLTKNSRLPVSVAEMQTYERLRQRVHKQSRQEARQAVTGKPASVLSSPVMQRHLRRGRKLMKEHESEIRLQEDAFDDLLENILLYDVRLYDCCVREFPV